jgi:hypothetical protein
MLKSHDRTKRGIFIMNPDYPSALPLAKTFHPEVEKSPASLLLSSFRATVPAVNPAKSQIIAKGTPVPSPHHTATLKHKAAKSSHDLAMEGSFMGSILDYPSLRALAKTFPVSGSKIYRSQPEIVAPHTKKATPEGVAFLLKKRRFSQRPIGRTLGFGAPFFSEPWWVSMKSRTARTTTSLRVTSA